MQAKFRKGFTLIEILIVVIILGILAAIVIPQFTSASEDAKVSTVRSNVQSIQAQIEMYRFQTADTPALTEVNIWTQLGTRVVVDGKTVGPWITNPAVNPFTNLTLVVAGVNPTSADGWAYDATLGRFYGFARINNSAVRFPQ